MLQRLPFSSHTRASSKTRQKVGLPPGAVVFTGRDRSGPVTLSIINYTEGHLQEVPEAPLDEVLEQRDRPGPSWINITGVHDASLIQRIGDHYGLHPLVQEDIAHTGQRPKMEVYDDHLYIVLKMLSVPENPPTASSGNGHEEAREAREPVLRFEQISLIVGDEWLLCFQEDPGDVFDPVRERLRKARGRIRSRGTDYLAYALVDVIIDHYFVVLEHLGNRIEELEDEVLGDATPATQEAINQLRRDLVTMRRMTWPVREIMGQMDRLESDIWDESTRPFVRDAYDHVVQVVDLVESLRESASGLTDLYMTSLSNRMNEIMKVLTIIGTIFIPLTFVAGIYGMNFEYMPELQLWWMYPLLWGVMALTGGSLLVFFRRKEWI